MLSITSAIKNPSRKMGENEAIALSVSKLWSIVLAFLVDEGLEIGEKLWGWHQSFNPIYCLPVAE